MISEYFGSSRQINSITDNTQIPVPDIRLEEKDIRPLYII